MLPTPQAMDCINKTRPAMMRANSPRIVSNQGIEGQAGLKDYAAAFPGDGKPIGGQLNPVFVEWLMGYPQGWTDLLGSGTTANGLEYRESQPESKTA
jgi:hypothetical protein